jgi:hypothetical protein
MSNDHDRVLIVTYLFPPSGGVGVPRFVNYAKYLPLHGCDVYVLTVRKPATPVYDAELAKQVPPETRVFRAFNPEVPYALRDRLWKRIAGGPTAAGVAPRPPGGAAALKRLAKRVIQRVFCPDVQVLWTPFAIRAARRIIREQRITTVLVNLPPYSCLKIAADVKRQFPGIKLILDFRDEWIENYFVDFDSAASEYKLRLARELEREAVVRADYVSAVTESQRRQIRKRYPDEPESKFLYMPNGYDPEIYRGMIPRPHTPGRMVITYFGTLYDNPAYRPVFDFLDALECLPPELRGVVEVWFIGRISAEAKPLLEGRATPIRRLGFMPQVKALEYLAQADYHLMVAGNPTTHAGKLFDYLASGKPMLGICHSQGEIGTLIRETRSGVTVELGDRDAAVRMVCEAFERAERQEPSTHDWAAIRFFEWPNLVARMARLTRVGDYR